MRPYEVFLRKEAVEALRSLPRSQKTRLGEFIDSLSQDPFQTGDYEEQDDTQRSVASKVIGQYAITFWVDHAVEEIKIIDIRRADGP